MTEKERQKRLDILRKTHDELKEHPFWVSFDKSMVKDVVNRFRELNRNVWGVADDSNKYYVILICVGHDFGSMLSCMLYNKEMLYDENFGDAVMVMQVFLMNIHNLLEKREQTGTPTGYTYSIAGGVKKFQAFLEEDGKYHAYNMVTKEKIPVIRRYLKKYASLDSDKEMTKWAKECIAELDEGKTEIGKLWKITE